MIFCVEYNSYCFEAGKRPCVWQKDWLKYIPQDAFESFFQNKFCEMVNSLLTFLFNYYLTLLYR